MKKPKQNLSSNNMFTSSFMIQKPKETPIKSYLKSPDIDQNFKRMNLKASPNKLQDSSWIDSRYFNKKFINSGNGGKNSDIVETPIRFQKTFPYQNKYRNSSAGVMIQRSNKKNLNTSLRTPASVRNFELRRSTLKQNPTEIFSVKNSSILKKTGEKSPTRSRVLEGSLRKGVNRGRSLQNSQKIQISSITSSHQGSINNLTSAAKLSFITSDQTRVFQFEQRRKKVRKKNLRSSKSFGFLEESLNKTQLIQFNMPRPQDSIKVNLDFGEEEGVKANKIWNTSKRKKVQTNRRSSLLLNKTNLKKIESKKKMLRQLAEIQNLKHAKSNLSKRKSQISLRSDAQNFQTDPFTKKLKPRTQRLIFSTQPENFYYNQNQSFLEKIKKRRRKKSPLIPKPHQKKKKSNNKTSERYSRLLQTLRGFKSNPSTKKKNEERLGEEIFKNAKRTIRNKNRVFQLKEEIRRLRREVEEVNSFLVQNQHNTDLEAEHLVTLQEINNEIESLNEQYLKLNSQHQKLIIKLQGKYNSIYQKNKDMQKLENCEELLKMNKDLKNFSVLQKINLRKRLNLGVGNLRRYAKSSLKWRQNYFR